MTIDVAAYTNHESYSFPDNDITIIELAQAVDLTTYTPACMAKTSDTTTFDGKNAWVYGEIILLLLHFDNDICGTKVGEERPLEDHLLTSCWSWRSPW